MKWEGFIPNDTEIENPFAEKEVTAESPMCDSIGPPQCRMVWQIVRTNPLDNQSVHLCFRHGEIWDRYFEETVTEPLPEPTPDQP